LPAGVAGVDVAGAAEVDGNPGDDEVCAVVGEAFKARPWPLTVAPLHPLSASAATAATAAPRARALITL
jgi:hypothetical protein